MTRRAAPIGHLWGLAVACPFACGMLTAPSLAAADASAVYENLSADAKLVVQTTNEAFDGEICENELKVIHKKVFEITNALRKAGAVPGPRLLRPWRPAPTTPGAAGTSSSPSAARHRRSSPPAIRFARRNAPQEPRRRPFPGVAAPESAGEP